MNAIVIIQSRMASSRLPGKVLLDLGEKPMLKWVVERAGGAERVSKVIVATTTDASDDPLFDFCQQHEIQVERGSIYDVLDRYFQTAKRNSADIVIRVTADCPLIDPVLIDEAVDLLTPEPVLDQMHQVQPNHQFDFVANRLPSPWGRSYPIGLDVEVFTFEILHEAWKLAAAKNQREHVTSYFYEGVPVDQLKVTDPYSRFSSAINPQGYKIALMHHSPDYGNLRWTVDTPEDLALVRAIVSHFQDDAFSWQDVLRVVQDNPELNQINAHVEHKTHLDVDDRN
jgi:spore coat polysaccharide biosynthesis protein SpsF